MFTFLLVVHGLIAAALVGVILVQKSEGGGLGMGSGGPSGLMTARGAADFLTRATTILATLFILMALALAAYASMRNGGGEIDTSLAHQGTPGPINAPVTPTSAIPMMGAPTNPPAGTDTLAQPAPAGAPTNAAGQPTAAPPPRPMPSIKALRTIDTHVGNSTVGINGIGGGNSATPAKSTPTVKLTPPAVTIPTIKVPAPSQASAPAKNEPVPAAPPATGNSTQP